MFFVCLFAIKVQIDTRCLLLKVFAFSSSDVFAALLSIFIPLIYFLFFRFSSYLFLLLLYFLLIYIDKNNTHLMDDDFSLFTPLS